MSSDRRQTDADAALLEAFFAAARAEPPVVPEGLMARVLADAGAQQPAPLGPVGVTRAAAPARGAWEKAKARGAAGWAARLGGLFGGGASFAGLALAGAAGLWIGFVQPFELGFDLQAATLEGFDLFPAEIDHWSAALDPDQQLED